MSNKENQSELGVEEMGMRPRYEQLRPLHELYEEAKSGIVTGFSNVQAVLLIARIRELETERDYASKLQADTNADGSPVDWHNAYKSEQWMLGNAIRNCNILRQDFERLQSKLPSPPVERENPQLGTCSQQDDPQEKRVHSPLCRDTWRPVERTQDEPFIQIGFDAMVPDISHEELWGNTEPTAAGSEEPKRHARAQCPNCGDFHGEPFCQIDDQGNLYRAAPVASQAPAPELTLEELPAKERIERTVRCIVCGWPTPGVPQGELHMQMAKIKYLEGRVRELENQTKTLRLWSNLGGAPCILDGAQIVCTAYPDHPHDIYGGGIALEDGTHQCHFCYWKLRAEKAEANHE